MEVDIGHTYMIELSRNITYDQHLKMYTIDAIIDGENETLVFDTREAAYKEYSKLRRNGAEILPLSLDGSL